MAALNDNINLWYSARVPAFRHATLHSEIVDGVSTITPAACSLREKETVPADESVIPDISVNRLLTNVASLPDSCLIATKIRKTSASRLSVRNATVGFNIEPRPVNPTSTESAGIIVILGRWKYLMTCGIHAAAPITATICVQKAGLSAFIK
jgi:hypothetical protein